MALRAISGRQKVIGPARTYPVPIALDPAVYAGTWVFGSDGEMHRSNGTEWKSVVQLAEDVAADVVRVLTDSTEVTVGSGGTFATLNDLFAFYRNYVPISETVEVIAKIKVGTVVLSQVDLGASDYSYIRLIIESGSIDTPIDVDTSLWTENSPYGPGAFLTSVNGKPPHINCHFRRIGTQEDLEGSTGLLVVNGTWRSSYGTRHTLFSGFKRQVYALNSQIILGGVDITRGSSDFPALEIIGGSAQLDQVRVAPHVTHTNTGLRVSSNASVLITGSGVSEFRQTAGVDTSTDVVVTDGSTIVAIPGTIGTNFGGLNIAKNRLTPDGLFIDSAAPMTPSGILNARSYTVGTVPSAAAYANSIIWVSNGNSGAPCLAVSNGTNWLRIVPGAAVST